MSDNATCVLTIVASFTFIVAMYRIWVAAGLKGPSILERAEAARRYFSAARSLRTKLFAVFIAIPVILYSAQAALFALFTSILLVVIPAGCKYDPLDGLAKLVRACADVFTRAGP